VIHGSWEGIGLVIHRSWEGVGLVIHGSWEGVGLVIHGSWEGIGLVIHRSRVRLPTIPLSYNDSRHVVHTPASVIKQYNLVPENGR